MPSLREREALGSALSRAYPHIRGPGLLREWAGGRLRNPQNTEVTGALVIRSLESTSPDMGACNGKRDCGNVEKLRSTEQRLKETRCERDCARPPQALPSAPALRPRPSVSPREGLPLTVSGQGSRGTTSC